ncbi:unnamed protein product, partial [Chrysoparadoxa australica]
ELASEFERFGRVEKMWVARNPPGFAFVWYTDSRDADDACRDMDGSTLGGKTLRVEVSRQRRGGDRGG